MFKRILVALLLFVVFRSCSIRDDSQRNADWIYVYELASKYQPDVVARRYADCVMKYAERYNVKPRYVARHIEIESGYDWNAKGDWNGKRHESWGPMQAKVHYHAGKLYHLDEGRLGAYLKKREAKGKRIDHRRYFCRIGYGVEMGCYLYRMWLDQYTNSYPLMLVAYVHGPVSSMHKRVRRDPRLVREEKRFAYVRKIMMGDVWDEKYFGAIKAGPWICSITGDNQ